MKKLDRLCEQHPDTYKCIWADEHIMADGIPMGKRYSVPKKLVRFGKPTSEARREAARKSFATRVQNSPQNPQ